MPPPTASLQGSEGSSRGDRQPSLCSRQPPPTLRGRARRGAGTLGRGPLGLGVPGEDSWGAVGNCW